MKKFFAIAAMALVTLVANAQTPDQGTFSITPKAGISYGGYFHTSYSAGQEIETQGSIGFTVGAEASYMAGTWFKPSIGVEYTSVANTFKYETGGDYTLTSGYLAIPVLANFYVSNGWALKVGVQPAFLLSASGSNDKDQKEFLNSTDFSIPIGTSYEFGNFMLDITFHLGITNTVKDGCTMSHHDKLSNGYGTFTIGYRLDLK